jgi:hypothetical protein
MQSPAKRVFSTSELLERILEHLSPLDLQAICEAWQVVRNSPLWKSRSFFARLGSRQLGRKFYTDHPDYIDLYCTLYKLHHTSLAEVRRQQPMRDTTVAYRLDRRYNSRRSMTHAWSSSGIYLPSESPGLFSGAFVYCTGKNIAFLRVDTDVITTVLKEHKFPSDLVAFSVSPDGRYLLCLLESDNLVYFILDDGGHATFVETDWRIGCDDFNSHMFLDQHTIMWPGPEGLELCQRSLRIGHRLRAQQQGDNFFYHPDIDLFCMRIDDLLNNSKFLNLGYRAFTDRDSAQLQLVHTIGCGKRHFPHKMVWVSKPDSSSCTSHYLVANRGFIVNLKPSPHSDCVFVMILTDKNDLSQVRESDLEFVSREQFQSPCTWTYDKTFKGSSLLVYQVAPGKPLKPVFFLKNNVWHVKSLFQRHQECEPYGGLQSDCCLAQMFSFFVTKHFIVVDRGSSAYITNYTAFADPSHVYRVSLGHDHAYIAVSDDLQMITSLEGYYNDYEGHSHGFRTYKLRYDEDCRAIRPGYHWNENLRRDESKVKCLPIANKHTYQRY